MAVLALIISGCLFADLVTTREPGYMDLANYTKAPGNEFFIRNRHYGAGYIFLHMVWRKSVYIDRDNLYYNIHSDSGHIWIVKCDGRGYSRYVYDEICGDTFVDSNTAPRSFLQAVMGDATVASISVVIGLTSWCSIAKIVRTEVKN